ncbi:MAG: FHA domain-containing protein [Candidatus Nanopelagicales bacterium]|jgi:pSer/pThr/pTyr-binding forkhead associated (FHA) protein|nr:FHA domain-containing protein [Candidatus Nanopelagicales bacterium]
MSELVITLMRFGFLIALWLAVVAIVLVLRRDLAAPKEARPQAAASRLPSPSAPPVPPQPRAPRGSGRSSSTPRKLTVVEGELAGTVIPLGSSPITVGRAADSTLVLKDDYASSRHARFFPSDGQWIVEDLGSTNGTWIERTRITGPTVLRVGAKVRVGRTTLQLQR